MVGKEEQGPRVLVQGLRSFKDRVELPLGQDSIALVGLNNSGKSSLLRLVWELRRLFEELSANGIGQFAETNSVGAVNRLGGERVLSHLPGSTPRIILDMGDRPDGHTLENWVKQYEFRLNENHAFELLAIQTERQRIPPMQIQWHQRRKRLQTGEVVYLPESGHGKPFNDDALREYADRLKRCMYVGPFRNAINVGGVEDYYDLAIGDRFVQRFHEMKAGNDHTANEAIASLQTEVERIFGFDRFELTPVPGAAALQVSIDGKSHRLSELGAGLAHFVLLLANALIRRPSWILVDEPELNLHATLQLELLSILRSYASETVCFATHSLGLARSMSDHILIVSKARDGSSQLVEHDRHPTLAQLAGELSFAGTPELGFDRVLLVEGRTDLRTFRQLLALYGAASSVLVLSLGGNDYISASAAGELQELVRIGGRFGAVIDSERTAYAQPVEANRQAFADTCKTLGIDCLILERRAIENYFSRSAIQEVYGDVIEEFDSYSKPPPGWSKSRNALVARNMDREDLDGTDLGSWLATYTA